MHRTDETHLAIVETVVDDRCGAAVKHFAGPGEIETAMPARQRTFRGIEVMSIN